jgi:hypothetical protein
MSPQNNLVQQGYGRDYSSDYNFFDWAVDDYQAFMYLVIIIKQHEDLLN